MGAKGEQIAPPRLTPTVHQRVVDAILSGATIQVAARHGGVGLNSARRWIDRGRDTDLRVRARINDGPVEVANRINSLDDIRPRATALDPAPRSPYELAVLEHVEPEHRTCWVFWIDIERAHAQFEVTNLALIEEAGRGYEANETTVVEKLDGEGNITQRTTTIVTKRVRYWQALAWLLERKYPERYARRTVTELVGADGGPIQTQDVTPEVLRERAVQLVDEVAAVRARREQAETHASGNGDGKAANDGAE